MIKKSHLNPPNLLVSILTMLGAFTLVKSQFLQVQESLDCPVKDYFIIFDKNYLAYTCQTTPRYFRIQHLSFSNGESKLKNLQFDTIYDSDIPQLSFLKFNKDLDTAILVIAEKRLGIQKFYLDPSSNTVTTKFNPSPIEVHTSLLMKFPRCYSNRDICMVMTKDGSVKKMHLFNPSLVTQAGPFSFDKSLDMNGPFPFRTSTHYKNSIVATISFSPSRLKLYDTTRATNDAQIATLGITGVGSTVVLIGDSPHVLAGNQGKKIGKYDFNLNRSIKVEVFSSKLLTPALIKGTYSVIYSFDDAPGYLVLNYKTMKSISISNQGIYAFAKSEEVRIFNKTMSIFKYQSSSVEQFTINNIEETVEFHKCQDFDNNLDCTQCSNNFELQADGSCICRSEAYQHDMDECDNCHGSCSECSGPGQEDCTSCQDENMDAEEGTCRCKEGFFGVASCQKCDKSCLGCSDGTASGCSSCLNNAQLSSSGECICFKGYLQDESTGECLKIENRVLLLKSKFNRTNSSIVLGMSMALDIETFKSTTIFYQEDGNDKNKKKTNVGVNSIEQIDNLIVIVVSNSDSLIKNKPILISIINSESVLSQQKNALFEDFPLSVKFEDNKFSPLNLPGVKIALGVLIATTSIINPVQGLFTIFLLGDLELFSYLEIEYPLIIQTLFDFVRKLNALNHLSKITPDFMKSGSQCNLPPKLSEVYDCGIFFNNFYLYLLLIATTVTSMILRRTKFIIKSNYSKKIIDSLFLVLQLRLFIGFSPLYSKIRLSEYSLSSFINIIMFVVCLYLLSTLIYQKTTPKM